MLSERNNQKGIISDPIEAFQLTNSISKVPIINESVLCIRISERWYYFSDVNIFNNKNNSSIGGFTYDRSGTYYGKTFIPQLVPNMQLFEGDTLINGRFGNTIRLGSTNADNGWSISGNNGSPITVLTNGGGNLENLDDDPSSIYLTSDQSLPIYLKSPTPKTLTSLEQYSGNSQVVIAADKLVFYTKDGIGDIVISGKGTSYLMGKKVHLATNEWSNVDVTALMDIIEGLIDQLKALTSGQANFATGVGPTGTATNAASVMKLKTKIGLLKG